MNADSNKEERGNIREQGIGQLLTLGGISGFLAVAMGAFGAHALSGRLSAPMMGVYRTAAQYQMAHTLALLLTALMAQRRPSARLLIWSGRLFVAGIALFSGSLYALVITGIRLLGAVTPLGGLCFLAGWALLALAGLQKA